MITMYPSVKEWATHYYPALRQDYDQTHAYQEDLVPASLFTSRHGQGESPPGLFACVPSRPQHADVMGS
jgi:hypothetical protein